MFSAIGRLFRAIGYLFTGRIDRAYQSLLGNTLVVEATYDNVIREKKNRINEYTSAIGTMISNEEKKKLRLKDLVEEAKKLEKLKTGALAKAKSIAVQYGTDVEKVKSDAEYAKCQGAYRDFDSTLTAKNTNIAELQKDIQDIGKNLITHKTTIQSLMRDLEKVKDKKGNAVANIISAQEEKKINQMISGISEDKTQKDLEALDNAERQIVSEGRAYRELSGMDTKVAENEFMEYASQTAVDDEFDKLIGLTKEAPASIKIATDSTKIAE